MIQELPRFGNLVSRSICSKMFFKIGVLKSFAIFTKNTCAGSCRPSFTEHLRWLVLDFRGSKDIFQLNLVYIADSCIGFYSELIWKHKLNLRHSHWNSSVKIGVLRNLHIFRKKPVLKSLLNRVTNF